MFRNLIILAVVAGTLGACNSVYMKPNSLERNSVVYADRGGHSMLHNIKRQMENRGFDIVVGKAKSAEDIGDGSSSIKIDKSVVPNNVQYIVKVSESEEKFRPIWCALNGFWWWNFSVSIADQHNGQEILSWRGRGCANSSLRKLNAILDKMEQ